MNSTFDQTISLQRSDQTVQNVSQSDTTQSAGARESITTTELLYRAWRYQI